MNWCVSSGLWFARGGYFLSYLCAKTTATIPFICARQISQLRDGFIRNVWRIHVRSWAMFHTTEPVVIHIAYVPAASYTFSNKWLGAAGDHRQKLNVYVPGAPADGRHHRGRAWWDDLRVPGTAAVKPRINVSARPVQSRRQSRCGSLEGLMDRHGQQPVHLKC